MLYLISPAKTLDYESPVPDYAARHATLPQFLPQSAQLIERMRRYSVAELATLMDLSEPLAALNVGRFASWSETFDDSNSRPCVHAFNGDVYEGLDAASLGDEDLAWAQQHLAILSGLYGVLRPLDRMQPYRLEMGSRVDTQAGRNLYQFWGDRLAEHLNQVCAAQNVPVIVNLASHEYFKAADRKCLKPRVIECQFEDWKAGKYKVISFFAKRARGLMARYAIEHRVDRPEGLLAFDAEGYRFVPEASSPDCLLFRRRLES